MALVPAAAGALSLLGGPMSLPTAFGLMGGSLLARKFRNSAIFDKRGWNRRRRVPLRGTMVRYRKNKGRPYGRRPRYKRRGKYRKRRGGRKGKLRRKVTKIAKQLNSDTGKLTWRERTVSQTTSAVNTQGVAQIHMNRVSDIESGPATKLYYYDPSTPGTLLNPDYTTGTFRS